MFLMGGATAPMGLLPTAAQIGVLAPALLLLLRIVQGFALGGEWAGAILLAVEHSPSHRRGLAGSVPQVGLALGQTMVPCRCRAFGSVAPYCSATHSTSSVPHLRRPSAGCD